MNPLLSWAIMLFVGGGCFWYYGMRSSRRARIQLSKPALERNENGFLTKKAKRKAKRSPDNTSSSGTPTPPAKPAMEVPEKQKMAFSRGDEQGDEGVDNREFAKQFSKVKEGTKLSATDNQANKKEARTKKIVSSAVETGHKDATVSSTRTSSTTGADADDDLSSVNSPVVNPTLPVAGDISDMLAPPPAAIPTLRLVGTPQSEQPTKKKQRPENTGETKKQRQRRLKNESRKMMVEEAEKERRIQLEKQLHLAREHERREVAKSRPPPVTNAWKTGATTNNNNNRPNGVSKSSNATSASLLDTFDPSFQPNAKPPVASENIKPSTYLESWASNLPSEEEQIRIILSENEWTTVSNRKKERKNDSKRAESVSVSETSSSDFQSVKEPGPTIRPPPPPQSATKGSTTSTLFPPTQSETFTGKGHPLDSDWDP
ncbi:hypothetical protein AJ78_07717 [Emergomyces pasteurianus Ep9510]|uniref:Uncharacterized protein n=1 Tax=Emergomyces pasteurianus Ep9510 TaxID=1447872 RepID=A0A1J9Q6H6_9EURO|nr:hypothetical protein AJ78_07717 [Emergomyces pasteurianus Ep9510]